MWGPDTRRASLVAGDGVDQEPPLVTRDVDERSRCCLRIDVSDWRLCVLRLGVAEFQERCREFAGRLGLGRALSEDVVTVHPRDRIDENFEPPGRRR